MGTSAVAVLESRTTSKRQNRLAFLSLLCLPLQIRGRPESRGSVRIYLRISIVLIMYVLVFVKLMKNDLYLHISKIFNGLLFNSEFMTRWRHCWCCNVRQPIKQIYFLQVMRVRKNYYAV